MQNIAYKLYWYAEANKIPGWGYRSSINDHGFAYWEVDKTWEFYLEGTHRTYRITGLEYSTEKIGRTYKYHIAHTMKNVELCCNYMGINVDEVIGYLK